MVVLTVGHKSLDGALGFSSLHEQKIAGFALLEELLFEERVHDGVDLVTIFSQFDFGCIYKRLYDLVNIVNPLASNIDGLTSKGVFAFLICINKVESQSQVIFGLDEAVNFHKVETTDKLRPGFILKAEQFMRR